METSFESCGNDVGDVRGLCSARRPNSVAPCEVALGFELVEGFRKDQVPIGFGMEVEKGVDRNEQRKVMDQRTVTQAVFHET